MKTLVVGNSLDVFPIMGNILSQNKEEQVTLFAPEGVLPYDRSSLPALAAGTVKEAELYQTAEVFLATARPVVVTSEVLARVSVRRKYLTTEKKTQISYDRLVVVDTGNIILPPVKGHQKTGVFDCWRLSSVKAMLHYLLLSDTVTVVASNIQGLNMACALSLLKKEVTVVSAGAGLLGDIFDEETGLLLKQILEGGQIRVFNDNAVEEILGDAEVKAVKLQSGKVLASDAVIFDEAQVDLRVLSEPTLTDPDQIVLQRV